MSEAVDMIKSCHKVAFGHPTQVTVRDIEMLTAILTKAHTLITGDDNIQELTAAMKSVRERNELLGAVLAHNYTPFYGDLESL